MSKASVSRRNFIALLPGAAAAATSHAQARSAVDDLRDEIERQLRAQGYQAISWELNFRDRHGVWVAMDNLGRGDMD